MCEWIEKKRNQQNWTATKTEQKNRTNIDNCTLENHIFFMNAWHQLPSASHQIHANLGIRLGDILVVSAFLPFALTKPLHFLAFDFQHIRCNRQWSQFFLSDCYAHIGHGPAYKWLSIIVNALIFQPMRIYGVNHKLNILSIIGEYMSWTKTKRWTK